MTPDNVDNTSEQSNHAHESEQTVSHTADLTAENTNPETQTEQIDDNDEEDKQVIFESNISFIYHR